MSRFLQCVGRYAELPYYFERLDRRIYSVEELCFILVQGAYMMDDDFPDENLISWLRDQCGLTELAERLSDYTGSRGEAVDAVRIILEYVRYNSRDEIERTIRILGENQGRNMYEKRLARAGHFLREGRLMRALAEYEEIRGFLAGAGDSLMGGVLHNEAVICARLFLFERAQKLFREAWEMTGNEASYLGYLAAVRMNCEEQEYVDFVAAQASAAGQSRDLTGAPPDAYALSLELEKRYDEACDLYSRDEDNLRIKALNVLCAEGRTKEFLEKIDVEIARVRSEYRSLLGER